MDPAKPSFKEALRALARRRERELEIHPPPAELVAYLDGELTGPEQERLRDHLAVCRPCAGLVRDLGALSDLEVSDEAARHLEEDVEAGWEALQNRLAGGEPKERRREGWLLSWHRPLLPFAIAPLVVPLLGAALMTHTFVKVHAKAALLLLGLTGLAGGLGWVVPEGVVIDGAREVAERIEGAETHTYRIPLRRGDFVRAAVDQKGADVQVTWRDPAGRKVLSRDGIFGPTGVEEAPLLAERTGDHLLEIAKLDPLDPPGWYRLEVDDVRRAKALDRRRFDASVAFSWAEDLRGQLPPEEALPAYQQAHDLWAAAGDPVRQAEALYRIGRIYRIIDQPEKALEAYRRAWRAWRGTPGEGNLLNAMGLAHRNAGRLAEALAFFERARRLGARTKSIEVEASACQNLAGDYRKQGEFQRALEAYQRAQDLRGQRGNARAQSEIANELGHLYLLLGQLDQARESFRQSLRLAQRSGDRALVAGSRQDLSTAAFQMGRTAEARQILDELLKEGGGTDAALLNRRGILELEQRQFRAARGWFEKAREVASQNGLQAEGAEALANLGYIDGIHGEHEAARTSIAGAETYYRRQGDLAAVALVLFGRARVFQLSGDLAAALAEIEESLELVETMRANPRSADVRSSFLARRHKAYRTKVELLMDLHGREPDAGYDSQAFTAGETARARTLLEALAVRGGNLDAGVDPDLLRREREAASELRDGTEGLMRVLARSGASDAEAGVQDARVRDLGQRLETAREEISRSHPRYADLVRPQPLTAAEVQRRVLDDETLLLAYVLGEEQSVFWLLGRNLLVSGKLPPEREIAELTRSAYRDLSRPVRRGARPEVSPALVRLSDILLAPIASHLGSKRLVVVPDGALHYIPFAALPDPSDRSRPLVARSEVVVLPSASVLEAIRRQAAGRRWPAGQVAVLADPVFSSDDPRVRPPLREQWGRTAPVPTPASEALRSARSLGLERLDRLVHSRAEAEAILSLAPKGRLAALDFAAGREVATDPGLGRYRIVHFATHGLFNPSYPHLSGIVLTQVDPQGRPQAGFLHAAEIYALDLPVDLVVLSACQTALGEDVRGEGVVGLTRGFLYAGASRVVVSLWSVDDRATAELMKRFYRAMLQDGLSPAAALRQAQLALARGGEWSAPYHWAAFVLQGEWH